MDKIYEKIKAYLSSPDMVHVWLSFFLTIAFACIFKLMDTTDKWEIIFISAVGAFFIGVFVESFDGFFGTKQLDNTGVQGDEFSPKDLLRDVIGCVLGMIAIGILVL